MKKFLKILMVTVIFIMPLAFLFTACVNKNNEGHIHDFSGINPSYCNKCESYIVKGEGSEYVKDGEVQNLEDVFANAEPKNGVMNYRISGKVEYNIDAETYKSGNLDLGKGAYEVNIIGEGDNAELTISGVHYAIFVANGTNNTKLNFENLTINSAREANSSWEFYHLLSNSTEVSFKNCKFTEGVLIINQQKAYFESCEFNVSGSHYSIWLGASGYSDFSTYNENVQSCIVKNCTFNSTRGIKVITKGATITIEGNLFNELTGKPGIVMDSNYGEINYITIKNNAFKNCIYGKYNSADNIAYENGAEAYSVEHFNVIETGTIIN